jgi:hypothetical protein
MFLSGGFMIKDLTTLSDDELLSLEKDLKNKISKFNNVQMAFKIAMNSLNYMAH